MASSNNPKLDVGVSMLAEAREGEFASVRERITKILSNIQSAPAEPKFRKLRTANPKIAELLATRGVKAVLQGAGFQPDGDYLTLPADAPTEAIGMALAAIESQAAERQAASDAKRKEAAAARLVAEKENEDERKRMRMGIQDDCAARKEPGWQAKAAGVKGGKAITSCADVGIGQSGG